MLRWLSRFRKARPEASLSEIRSSFDQASADEEHFPSSIDPRIFHVQLILRTFGDLTGKTVADVGCGKGRFARILSERHPGARIIAVDLSERMLHSAGPPLLPVSASMTTLPLRTASCDAAYATESLEHAVDIETAVAELCRIVKPHGRIVIIDKNVEHWGRFKTPSWERWFERRELERMLGRHCRSVASQFISYWEDVPPDGLFIAWTAEK